MGGKDVRLRLWLELPPTRVQQHFVECFGDGDDKWTVSYGDCPRRGDTISDRERRYRSTMAVGRLPILALRSDNISLASSSSLSSLSSRQQQQQQGTLRTRLVLGVINIHQFLPRDAMHPRY